MKVVLIGDSIRMGYQPFVAKKLPEAEVWGPPENCRHSHWVYRHFQQWIADQQPDLLHINFGIHDCGPREGPHLILLPQYQLSLKRIIAKVTELKKTKMIWATSTPLYKPDPDKPMVEWQIREETNLKEYNDAALEIVKEAGIPVNDLHEVIMQNDFSRCLLPDGCHMTDFGNEVLSDAVVRALRAGLDRSYGGPYRSCIGGAVNDYVSSRKR